MNIYEKLLNVQVELKAPKGQLNKFGGYKYRSCEDILEALKPILSKYKLALFVNDEVINIQERFYIKSTVNLINIEEPNETITSSALAREETAKKGMDGSQITGASSSYARKYALNGMFAIDDTKDSDFTNHHGKAENEELTEAEKKEKAIKNITTDIKEADDEVLEKCLEYYKKRNLGECSIVELENIKTKIEHERKKREAKKN